MPDSQNQYKKVLKWAAAGTHQFSKMYSKHKIQMLPMYTLSGMTGVNKVKAKK